MVRAQELLDGVVEEAEVGRVLVPLHLLDLPLKLRRQHLVSFKGGVEVLDLLAVEQLLHNARANVGGGPNTARGNTLSEMAMVRFLLEILMIG